MVGQSVTDNSMTDSEKLLEQLRITPDKQLPKMDFLFQLFGKPCFPRRELVAITGKAKSGKTFISSMLMAVGTSSQPSPDGDSKGFSATLKRTSGRALRVLWYDTEQSDESTQDILKNRIIKMMGSKQPTLFDNPDEQPVIDVFNVRAVEWKQRRSLLYEAIAMCSPDLVIVDGIRDLVNDINDGVLAQEVMEELMHLASNADCCIACVLHQNKSGEDHNLRGWIGTELMNKAFEIYSCEKLMPQRIFKFGQENSRKYDIEQKLYFEVGNDGLPKPTSAPATEGGHLHGEPLPQLNSEYIISKDDGSWEFDIEHLFMDAFANRDELSGSELRDLVMSLSGISVPFFYNTLLKKAIEGGKILRRINGNTTIYCPAPF